MSEKDLSTVTIAERDLRATAFYREAQQLYQNIRRPGTGAISDAAELHICAQRTHAVFSATVADCLEGALPTRLCELDLESGALRILTLGSHTDRAPKYAPSGNTIAFLSDRHCTGDFQLYLLDCASGAVRAAPTVQGWIEYLQWSSDGQRILLGVAGHGADVSGAQGAIPTTQTQDVLPSWLPAVDTGEHEFQWRSAWIYEVATNRVRCATPPNVNVWESVWCGEHGVTAIVSAGPSEGLWYSARLCYIDLVSGTSRELFAPQDQLGVLAASPSGRRVALVEAVCSDRGIIAGNLRLIDLDVGTVERIALEALDVSSIEWTSENHLLLAGHRGLHTVIGRYDIASRTFKETWTGTQITSGIWHATVAALDETGGCALIGEGFTRAPEIAVIRDGCYRVVRSFDLGFESQANAVGAIERVTWISDGLEIEGWLLRPKARAPHATIVHVHGGPIWLWRPTWLGRKGIPFLMLLGRGYALFFPNPRGSTGRGHAFARHVLGDMGGADARDILSGVDHLIAGGIADPERLGITGVSYGGFMTYWLTAHEKRFAAAVAVAPISNFVTHERLSNIPCFASHFIRDRPTNLNGQYYLRSPLFHAHKVTAATLNICGALDRCTPPEEAAQFHSALLAKGLESVLVTYPLEGHGVRHFPAVVDYAARLVGWFEAHLGQSSRETRVTGDTSGSANVIADHCASE